MSIMFSDKNPFLMNHVFFSVDQRCKVFVSQYKLIKGAQWISGRVLDSRPKGRGFKFGSAGIVYLELRV